LTTLLKLVDHSDPNLRWGVMNAVVMFDPAEPCRYEDVLLQREVKEPVNRVRAQIVQGLGTACGRLGSMRTLELIGRALGDGEPVGVQLSAITALRTVRLPGGAERLLGKLTAPSPIIRAAAARRLQGAYPADARKGRDVIERALAAEADPAARRALRELLASLDRP
jgi:hypothetical protein